MVLFALVELELDAAPVAEELDTLELAEEVFVVSCAAQPESPIIPTDARDIADLVNLLLSFMMFFLFGVESKASGLGGKL